MLFLYRNDVFYKSTEPVGWVMEIKIIYIYINYLSIHKLYIYHPVLVHSFQIYMYTYFTDNYKTSALQLLFCSSRLIIVNLLSRQLCWPSMLYTELF